MGRVARGKRGAAAISGGVAVGLDGCRGGWVAAWVDDRGIVRLADRPTLVEAVEHAGGPLGELRTRPAEACCIAVDMPIGLADAQPRLADRLARQQLGPRASSVFSAPIRAVLACGSFGEACSVSAVATGRKLSIQAWNLVPKIREADALAADGALGDRLMECHPELAFARLLGGPAKHRKKEVDGQRERFAILRKHLPLPTRLATFRDRARREAPKAAIDDALDALACLLTARRALLGDVDTLPNPPPRDANGRPMRIVAPRSLSRPTPG